MPKRFTPREITKEEKDAAVLRMLERIWAACGEFVDSTSTEQTRPVPAWEDLDMASRRLFIEQVIGSGIAGYLGTITGAVTADHEQRRN